MIQGPNNTIYTQLLNRGPQTMRELDGTRISPKQRQDGVMKFNPSCNASGGYGNPSGRTLPIYYIEGKHTENTVIQKWLEVNDKQLKRVTDPMLHKRISAYGTAFKEASREVLDNPATHDGYSGEDNPYEPGGTCPMCGEEYSKNLPSHLPCDS